MGRKAIILGATGLVGSACLIRLLKSGLYDEVVAVTRQPLSVADEILTNLVTDFSQLEAAIEQVGAQDLYCCLGTTMKKAGGKEAFRQVDYEYPYRAAKAFAESSGRHFLLVTALGADPKSRVFYNRVKGELEVDIKALDLPFTSVARPSLLLGERNESRFAEQLSVKASKFLSPIFVGPLKSVKPVEASNVAESLVNEARCVVEQRRAERYLIIESGQLHR